MQKIIKLVWLIIFLAVTSSCNDTAKKGSLDDKKADLLKLQQDRAQLDDKITSLQKDIAKLDTSADPVQKPKLVAIVPVSMQEFKHYLQLQGSVDDKNVSYITPSGQPGQLKDLLVKQGDFVKKGQLVAKLDDAVAVQNVIAMKQQLGGVQSQLDLAKSIYDRQKNLWDQHIGTEVQLLTDKTNVEILENNLKTVQASVNTAEASANLTNVYSNVNGIVDEVTTHVGETFSGLPPAGYIKVVDQSNVKVTVIIPENYMDKVSKGSTVEVQVPDINKTFSSTITFLSETIGTSTRGLTAQIKVPEGLVLRPNQVAVVNILDYSTPSTVVINVNTLQTDESGKFVLVAVKEGDKLVARKRKVLVGQLSGDQIEVKGGLQPGEQLITEGYQSLYDGQSVTTTGV